MKKNKRRIVGITASAILVNAHFLLKSITFLILFPPELLTLDLNNLLVIAVDNAPNEVVYPQMADFIVM